VDVDKKFVTARGTCWDLENNTAVSVEVQRRITDSKGRLYNDDMIGVTSNAACAIALRNAVFKVVPMAMVKPIYDAARKVAIGDAQTLNARRHRMVDHFGKMGVRLDQILSKVERASIEDISLDDLAVLIGLSTAIKDGDTSVDEAFAAAETAKKETSGTKSDALVDKLKKTEPPSTKAETKQQVERVSQLRECVKFLDSKKAEGVECIDSTPEGDILRYKLPNGETIKVCDNADAPTAPGFHSVDTLEPDAIQQVINIYDASVKKKK
jgi:hypothetical protein